MAEQQRRGVDKTAEERKWRTRWFGSAAAKAERLAHWRMVQDLYQARHWARRTGWQPDPVLNFSFMVTEEHEAQLSQILPEPVFQPRRPGDEGITEAFRQVIKYGWRSRRVPDVMEQVNQPFLLKGIGLYQPFWNNALTGGRPEPVLVNRPLVDPRSGQPLVHPSAGTPLSSQERIAEGDVWKGDWDVRKVDPAHFFVDPGLAVTDLQQAGWCGTGEMHLLSRLRRRYKDLPKEIGPANPDILMLGYQNPTVTYQQTADGDGYAYVFEGYEKRECDDQHRQAGYQVNLRKSVLVNWQLVEVQDYFYKHGLYPFVPQHNLPVEGQFWGMGLPQQFIALERLVRKLYEVVALGAMLATGPQYMLDPLAGIRLTDITSEPGKVYMPGPGINPERLQHILTPVKRENIPQYVFQFIETLKADINQVAGMFSGLPPNVRAASAIIAVFEKQAARVKKMGKQAGKAARGIIEQAAGLITEHYSEPRVIRLAEPIDGMDWRKVQGSDFEGLEFDIDVDVQATAPMTKAVTAEQANLAYSKGALSASQFLRAIDFPHRDIVDEVRRQEEAQTGTARAINVQRPGQAPNPAAAAGAGMMPPGLSPENLPPNARQLILSNVGGAGRV